MKCLLCKRCRARLGGEAHGLLRGEAGPGFPPVLFGTVRSVLGLQEGLRDGGDEVSKELACVDCPPSQKKTNLRNSVFSVFYMLDSK